MSRRNRSKVPSKKSFPVYLFVEGEKTERFYFELLRDKLNISDLTIYPTKGKSGYALLEKSKSKIKLKNLDKTAPKYLIFDKDALTQEQLADVFEKAEQEDFKIGFSNLNFEVWLLAHFEKLTKRPTSPSDTKLLEKKLTEKLKQPYKKSDSKQLEKIIFNYEQAIENASMLNKADFNYQCTTIGTMIEEILNQSATARNEKGGN